jgi:hypothetical protein
MHLHHRLFVSAALAALFVPRLAAAQLNPILVVDPAVVSEATDVYNEEIKAFEQAVQMVAMLKQINASTQAAITPRDPSELGYVLGILKTTQNNYDDLVANTNSIGYSLKNIHSSFSAMFPPAGTIRTMPSSQFDAVYTNTEAEILTASEIAARSQTSVSEI